MSLTTPSSASISIVPYWSNPTKRYMSLRIPWDMVAQTFGGLERCSFSLGETRELTIKPAERGPAKIVRKRNRGEIRRIVRGTETGVWTLIPIAADGRIVMKLPPDCTFMFAPPVPRKEKLEPKPCLGHCGKMFTPKHKHNWMCPRCAGVDAGLA